MWILKQNNFAVSSSQTIDLANKYSISWNSSTKKKINEFCICFLELLTLLMNNLNWARQRGVTANAMHTQIFIVHSNDYKKNVARVKIMNEWWAWNELAIDIQMFILKSMKKNLKIQANDGNKIIAQITIFIQFWLNW